MLPFSEVWAKGADGGIELAEKLLEVLDTKEAHFEHYMI